LAIALSNAPANAGLIISGTVEIQAIECSSEPACQPLNESDVPQEKANRLTGLGKNQSLPASGADASGSVIVSGGTLAAHLSLGRLLRPGAAFVRWLAHSRFLFCPTLLPSGLFRPPRLSP
jgi:hypothetical protein